VPDTADDRGATTTKRASDNAAYVVRARSQPPVGGAIERLRQRFGRTYLNQFVTAH
jgi:hypothetical protein